MYQFFPNLLFVFQVQVSTSHFLPAELVRQSFFVSFIFKNGLLAKLFFFRYVILTKQYRRDFFILVSRYGICTKQAARYRNGQRQHHVNYYMKHHHRRENNSSDLVPRQNTNKSNPGKCCCLSHYFIWMLTRSFIFYSSNWLHIQPTVLWRAECSSVQVHLQRLVVGICNLLFLLF